MSAILTSLHKTVIAGFVLALGLFAIYAAQAGINSNDLWKFLFRWGHVLFGVMWIGLLWYFNFVQVPSMPKIPDEHKPAISKVIAPAALWWFRWAAMGTIITGLFLAWLNGYFIEVISVGMAGGTVGHAILGVGMWFGIIMWANVWFIIWPNQQKVLGLVEADAAAKAVAGRAALLASRTNTLLSVPMLFAMISAQNLFSLS